MAYIYNTASTAACSESAGCCTNTQINVHIYHETGFRRIINDGERNRKMNSNIYLCVLSIYRVYTGCGFPSVILDQLTSCT